jgi:cyclohexanone monooxygenase
VIDAYRSGAANEVGGELDKVVEMVNFDHMERLRQRIGEIVADADVAESLKPYYGLFCKRPCFNDEYLASFNRSNVSLVDTDGRGVERITERGVVANGIEYEVDCIVYATGFEVGTGYERRAGVAVHGRDGRTLTEKWDDAGIRTLHGRLVNGYPNCFIVSQFQAGWTANYTHLLDEAAAHIAFIVDHVEREGLRYVEATHDAEEEWARIIVDNATTSTGGIGGTDCTPGYYNNEGRELDGPPYGTFYGPGSIAYFDLMRRWREAGDFAGVTFGAAASDG